MNWYIKYSQSKIKTKPTYFDVGFENKNANKSYVWQWINGKLKIRETTDINDKHSFSNMIEGMTGQYRGRIEISPSSKKITVIKPLGIEQFIPIPNIILNAIFNKFGQDIEIIESN